MSDTLDLGGRNAVITGAGQGIGRATAKLFAAHGAGTVFVNDLFADRAEATAEQIVADGGKAVAIPADVSDHVDVQRMASVVHDAVDAVHIVVNNAGVLPTYPAGGLPRFVDTSFDDWEPWIKLNLFGVMSTTRAFLPDMVKAEWGRVLTVISDASIAGDVRLAAYAAGKAGAAGFTRVIASEYGRNGVTANCVSLGYVRSGDHDYSDPEYETLFDRILPGYPTRRLGENSDVANAILYLCSPASPWITGQTLHVNGGFRYGL